MAKKKKTSHRKKRQRSDPSSDAILRDVADELDAIEALLRVFPEIEQAAQLFDTGGDHSSADPFSEWARSQCGVNLIDVIEQGEGVCDSFPNLTDLPNAPSVIVDTARWRIRRLSVLLQLIVRKQRD